MKLLLAFVTAASLFCLPLHAEEVIVNASAKIYNSDTIHARDQALKNVLVEAVKKGVGSLLDTKTTNINYEVIKSQIYSASKKFVLDYEVLSEQQNFVDLRDTKPCAKGWFTSGSTQLNLREVVWNQV